MRRTPICLLAGFAALTLAGCADRPVTPPPGAQTCPTPRPTLCTREYRPVVGYDAAGHRVDEYGNHCTACGDEKVLYTLPKGHD